MVNLHACQLLQPLIFQELKSDLVSSVHWPV